MKTLINPEELREGVDRLAKELRDITKVAR